MAASCAAAVSSCQAAKAAAALASAPKMYKLGEDLHLPATEIQSAMGAALLDTMLTLEFPAGVVQIRRLAVQHVVVWHEL